MNYIREINAFMDWLETNPLEATTQTLWFHIMAIANKSGWPEWFTIANLTLMARVNISENTLIKHRNYLIQKGRIQYKNQGKQKAGKYKLIPFTSKNEVNHSVKDSVTSNIEVNHEVKCEVNHEVNHEVKPSVLYKLNKTKQIDDIDNSQTPFQETVELFRKAGMGEINQTIAEVLGDIADNYPLELIQEAFKRAGIKNATSIRYVEKILISWERKGIKSLAQLEAYENNRRGNYGTSKGDNGRSSQGDDPYAGIGLTL